MLPCVLPTAGSTAITAETGALIHTGDMLLIISDDCVERASSS